MRLVGLGFLFSLWFVSLTTRIEAQFYSAPFVYTTNNDAATIIGYTGVIASVNIPATLGGLPVVAIGNGAFFNNKWLTNIIITNNVQNLGTNAFLNCSNLTTIKL